MASVNRIRSEYMKQTVYPVDAATVIEQGDFLVAVAGKALPASSQATADAVADIFIGVAMTAKRAAEAAKNIVVAEDAIVEMDLASGSPLSYPVGTAMEVYVTGGAAVKQTAIVGSSDPIGKLDRVIAVGDVSATIHIVGVDVKSIPVAD